MKNNKEYNTTMEATNLDKNGNRVPVMHGENFFEPIDAMPTGKTTEHTLYIAGHSETGHHHILKSKIPFEVFEAECNSVLLKDVGELYHKKAFDIHETQFLAPGAYKITHKTEYDPFAQVRRAVWD